MPIPSMTHARTKASLSVQQPQEPQVQSSVNSIKRIKSKMMPITGSTKKIYRVVRFEEAQQDAHKTAQRVETPLNSAVKAKKLEV